jgi:hypothetical protein
MDSIVNELVEWTSENKATLLAGGVQIQERFPAPKSQFTWKASIGLSYNDTVISFTVWERTICQIEFIVMNARTKKTLIMDDRTPEDAKCIRGELDQIVQRLLSGYYESLEPDPRLIVS